MLLFAVVTTSKTAPYFSIRPINIILNSSNQSHHKPYHTKPSILLHLLLSFYTLWRHHYLFHCCRPIVASKTPSNILNAILTRCLIPATVYLIYMHNINYSQLSCYDSSSSSTTTTATTKHYYYHHHQHHFNSNQNKNKKLHSLPILIHLFYSNQINI